MDLDLIVRVVGAVLGIGIPLYILVRIARWMMSSDEIERRNRIRSATHMGDLRRAGDLQAKDGNFTEAARLYEQGGEHGRLARVLLKMDDRAGAAAAYARAGELANAAKIYDELGEHDKAASLYSRDGDPKSAWRAARSLARAGEYARAGRAFQMAGDFENAAGAYARADRLDPPDVLVTMLENAALAIGKDEKKRKELLHRAASAAYKLGLHERAAQAFLGAGRVVDAAKLYERALERFDLAAALYDEAGRREDVARLVLRAGELPVLRAPRRTRTRARRHRRGAETRARDRSVAFRVEPGEPPAAASRGVDSADRAAPAAM